MALHQEIGPVKIYSPTKSGGVWQVTWTPQGMPRQVKQRKKKADALELAREIRGQLKRGEIGRVHRVTAREAEWIRLCKILDDPERILNEAVEKQEAFGRRHAISECCEKYVEEYADYERAATRNDARARATIIENSLGERYLDSITPHDVEKWRDALTGSKRHKNNTHSHLRHLFERAQVWGWAPDGFNPAKKIASLRIAKSEPVIWSPEKLQTCFNWCLESELKPSAASSRIVFLALGAFAGMRPSEIEGVATERPGLLWEDIDFERRHIHVRPEVAGKLAEPRYIAFTERATSGLSAELADTMWNALVSWLTPHRKDLGPVSFRRTQSNMSTELKSAGVIESWPKDGLRHTWISSLLALGVSRDWIAELAGNSPAIIKSNYKRPLPEEVAARWFSVTCLNPHP